MTTPRASHTDDTGRRLPDSPLTSEPQLRSFCNECSSRTTVVPATDGQPEWVVHEDRLENSRADYFNIGRYATDNGTPVFLMTQEEGALIMLLVADIDGVPAVLLGIRAEPGLIGLTNLTTTIQSTPSNYLRKHGGKATPFLEVAANPRSYGSVVYDGEHHDWGNYYAQKTKRFLIVRLTSAPLAPDGYRWVALAAVRQLLLADDLITTDLRVSLTLLCHPRVHGTVSPPEPRPSTEAACPLRRLAFGSEMVDAQGTTISFFRTNAPSREVVSWIQPLLSPAGPLVIGLTFIHQHGERRFAVERRTQPGLFGQRLWFPADTCPSSRVVRRLETCAEGGRFWKHRIFIELREAESPDPLALDAADPVAWMSESEVSDCVATPQCTSLELRLAWSLVQGGKESLC